MQKRDFRSLQMRRGLKAITVILSVVIGFVAWQTLIGQHHMATTRDWPSQFQSNGERIYFTGSSASGLSINARGGNSHMSMMAGSNGCVTCHGADRQGGRQMPNFWKSAPPLTSEALFNSNGGEDGHGDHDGYSDETLRRAINRGIDAGGKPLDEAMPLWSISKPDLDDLIAFLKSPATEKEH